ncbi:MAG: hypothetical protein C0467_10345 [Planctomycetaceae bacterium]|nr:hypothetical protein [Planctomycetaceae bacterium]
MGTAFNLACLLGAWTAFVGTAAAQTPGLPGQSGVPSAQTAPPLAVPLPIPQPAIDRTAVAAQDAKGKEQPKLPASDPSQYTVLPDREKIFVIYDDAQLERIIMNSIRESDKKRQVKMDGNYESTLRFPPMPEVGAGIPFQSKTSSYPPMQTTYDALFVVHRRLHFEEKNAERYGWDLGIIQPMVSALYFYRDVAMWPQSLASGFAYGFWDTNAGKCLPGSPTPYYLYPPGLTITGSAFEGVIITGLAFVFP